jgi:chromosome segregation ATPase
MDKKKLYQIETLKTKLKTYNDSLNNILNQKKILEEQLTTINPDRNKIIELQKQKQYLETKLQQLKKTISTINSNINKTNIDIKALSGICDNKLQNEITILKTELERIENKKQDELQTYYNNLENAKENKEYLLLEIQDIQTAINQQNAIISDLQMTAHSSRKSTLEELHQKKANKVEINKQCQQLQLNINNFQEQIESLSRSIKKLQEFKILIVNINYNTGNIKNSSDNDNSDNDNSDDNEKYVASVYLEFDIDVKLSINEKLKLIDKKIDELEKRLQIIQKKANKHKLSTEIRINQIVENYNKTNNRTPRISYKDQYKNEKEKRTQYINILTELQNKYNNWETNIIGTIDNNYKNICNELIYDESRAHQRLEIMKSRFEEEYISRLNDLQNIIINLTEEMKSNSLEFNNINDKIKEIQINIEKEDNIGNSIYNLDIEINKFNNMISQTNSNIIQLSS